jgi:hypothetical protein
MCAGGGREGSLDLKMRKNSRRAPAPVRPLSPIPHLLPPGDRPVVTIWSHARVNGAYVRALRGCRPRWARLGRRGRRPRERGAICPHGSPCAPLPRLPVAHGSGEGVRVSHRRQSRLRRLPGHLAVVLWGWRGRCRLAVASPRRNARGDARERLD